MTDASCRPLPFWKRKRLEEMTEEEWESLCDGCGRCCLEKVGADDAQETFALDIACNLLDIHKGRCGDYANRLDRHVGCFQFSPETIDRMGVVPETCAYDRVRKGKDLAWWHPLISGRPDTVHEAGISVRGRAIPGRLAGRWEFHSVTWPAQDPVQAWMRARFGGVTASVVTPFGADGGVDCDAMAAHCFWLLANGCNHLAILDRAGEVAALAMRERLGLLDGLVARGVPASKLLVGLGRTANLELASRAAALGMRGVMLAVAKQPRTLPHRLLPDSLHALTDRLGGEAAIYLSIAAPDTGLPTFLTGLEAWIGRYPGVLSGLRDDTPGAPLISAVLGALPDAGLEVYAEDEGRLDDLVMQGAAGVISPRMNLLGRLCAASLEAGSSPMATRLRSAIRTGATVIAAYPEVPAIKAALARHTGNEKWARVRPPLRAMGARQQAAFLQTLDASGLGLPPLLDAAALNDGSGEARAAL